MLELRLARGRVLRVHGHPDDGVLGCLHGSAALARSSQMEILT
jgi:LmbE family N-acetylglucosaminyl deacetylase